MEMRRFQCRNRACPRRTFAEAVPELAPPHQRCRSQLAAARCYIAFALGGKAGSRLAAALDMRASGDTLLRLLRRSPPLVAEEPLTAIGIETVRSPATIACGTVVVDLGTALRLSSLPRMSSAPRSSWNRQIWSVESSPCRCSTAAVVLASKAASSAWINRCLLIGLTRKLLHPAASISSRR